MSLDLPDKIVQSLESAIALVPRLLSDLRAILNDVAWPCKTVQRAELENEEFRFRFDSHPLAFLVVLALLPLAATVFVVGSQISANAELQQRSIDQMCLVLGRLQGLTGWRAIARWIIEVNLNVVTMVTPGQTLIRSLNPLVFAGIGLVVQISAWITLVRILRGRSVDRHWLRFRIYAQCYIHGFVGFFGACLFLVQAAKIRILSYGLHTTLSGSLYLFGAAIMSVYLIVWWLRMQNRFVIWSFGVKPWKAWALVVAWFVFPVPIFIMIIQVGLVALWL